MKNREIQREQQARPKKFVQKQSFEEDFQNQMDQTLSSSEKNGEDL